MIHNNIQYSDPSTVHSPEKQPESTAGLLLQINQIVRELLQEKIPAVEKNLRDPSVIEALKGSKRSWFDLTKKVFGAYKTASTVATTASAVSTVTAFAMTGAMPAIGTLSVGNALWQGAQAAYKGITTLQKANGALQTAKTASDLVTKNPVKKSNKELLTKAFLGDIDTICHRLEGRVEKHTEFYQAVEQRFQQEMQRALGMSLFVQDDPKNRIEDLKERIKNKQIERMEIEKNLSIDLSDVLQELQNLKEKINSENLTFKEIHLLLEDVKKQGREIEKKLGDNIKRAEYLPQVINEIHEMTVAANKERAVLARNIKGLVTQTAENVKQLQEANSSLQKEQEQTAQAVQQLAKGKLALEQKLEKARVQEQAMSQRLSAKERDNSSLQSQRQTAVQHLVTLAQKNILLQEKLEEAKKQLHEIAEAKEAEANRTYPVRVEFQATSTGWVGWTIGFVKERPSYTVGTVYFENDDGQELSTAFDLRQDSSALSRKLRNEFQLSPEYREKIIEALY